VINCPFEIEHAINNEIVDTLTAGYVFDSIDCDYGNSLNIGLIVDLESGV
jgi:hypothetical protein